MRDLYLIWTIKTYISHFHYAPVPLVPHVESYYIFMPPLRSAATYLTYPFCSVIDVHIYLSTL